LATVTDLRDAGAQVTNAATPIIEPINAQQILTARLGRFGDHYNTSQDSHLFRFLAALCGEASAGSLKKEAMLPRLSGQLANTHFQNLDRLYGDGLGLPRMSTEVYTADPEIQALTTSQWDEVAAKDASYRERCLKWMRAILEGPTKHGIELAAEAALGVECDVIERYQFLDNVGLVNYGQFASRNEFTIIPRTASITDRDQRRLNRLIEKLKPVNTVNSLFFGNDVRTARSITSIDSSSNKFKVVRMVTGRTDINWPALDPNNGLWIVSGTATEAPSFAFVDRQEAVTYLDISSATATSEMMGNFNAAQRALFSNLAKTYDPDTYFSAISSYAKSIAPLNMSQAWVNTSRAEAHDKIVANLNYSLRYFAVDGVTPSTDTTSGLFWSSVEKLPTETDRLTFDFGRTRPCNMVAFEMTPKPFTITIEYDDGAGNWLPVEDNGQNIYSLAMTYMPSMENPWVNFEYRFNTVVTERIRISFQRTQTTFPLLSSPLIPYSVDVRGVRLMHTMATKADFIADMGTDILGNAYTTQLNEYVPTNVAVDDLTYWSSKPNPARNAVEALYFDLRITSHQGTQSFLDGQIQDDLDDRGQSNVELYYSDGQVVDEIFIDPVAPGADMHFYFSNDDNPIWDEKLWTPVPRNYICRKGYHPLPTPALVRYFKIEFSNLPSMPYQPVEYPTLPKVQYNTYPTWVTDFIDQASPRDIPTSLEDIETVKFEPLDLFQKVDDRMGQSFEEMRSDLEQDHDPEVKTQIETLLNMQVDQTPQTTIESTINYRSTVMWQSDLLQQLDPTSYLSRVAMEARGDFTDTGFNSELGLPAYVPPIQQSSSDLSTIAEEKTRPVYWFPRTCRHGYKVMEASLDAKIAYMVAIRQVLLLRRNYTLENDEPVYIETMDDTFHIQSIDFTSGDNAYVIGQ